MSNNSSSSNSSSGIGFLGLLTIAFIVLKLIGIIDWSWWYVLMPSYIIILFLIVIIFGAALFAIIPDIINKFKRNKNNE